MNLFDNRDLGNISFQAPMSGVDDDVKQDFQSKKESSDDELFGELAKGYGSFSKEINPEVRAGAMADVAGVKSRLQRYGTETPDEDGVSQRFKSTFHDIVAPKQTPERRMRQYAQSDAALDAVLDDDFSKDMKQRLDKNRQASQNEINSDYIRNTSVVGANPEMTFNISLKAHDPLKDVEKTIVETDYEKLAENLAPIVKHGGYDMQEYVNERAVPAMYEKLLDEIIEDEVPKSSAEYILRSSIGNSLTGKAALLGKNLLTGNIADTQLQSEALGRYNPGFFEDVFSGVGSLLVDGPVFSSMGSLGMHAMGKVTGLLTKRLSTRILASKLGEGMTTATATQLAERLITRKLAHKILVSSGTQGITLGGYDAMNSVVDDLLAQNDVSMGKAAGSFGKGLLTGAVLGAVGTPLRESAKGLTGAKKMLASSGVLSAESAIFTAGTEIEKLKHDIDIAPIDLMEDFAKSTATLILMKMAHWRPKGADIKLDAKGKLKEGFALSNSEKAELRELNVNPEQLMAAIEAELKLPSFGGERARFIKEAYSKLMTDERLSASAKSKLLFLVDNRITTTPPLAFDYDVKQRDDNKWNVITYNPAGKVVSDELFDHAGNARSYMMVNRAMIRRNRIVLFETELTGGFRSENFLRQAGLYAREKNRNIDDIAVAIYKKCTGEELAPGEKVIVDEILERASYEEAGMVQMLYDVRRKIEKRHGLDEGSMMLAINKHFYNLTEKQNNALDEYEKVVRDEVDRLKKGTERRRAVRLLKEGLTSEYFGMSNEEVKEREIEDYHNWVAERDADRVGLKQESYTPGPPRLMYIPPEDNSGYVWSFGEAKNTKEDIAAYSKRADEMGERLGVKLNYIFDEREIVRPDPEDYRAVVEYNNQIVASGWLNKEKVFINLPNAKNMQDLEKTVLHEVVGHKGLLNVFGEHLYDFMEDVFRKASPEVLRGINKIKHKYKSVDNYTLIEEYLAYLAESVSLEPAERSLYVKVKDYIKSLLIRMNLYTGSNRQISEAELIRIMQRHCEYMQRGVAPQEYIKEVFGDFKSAHFNENTYHNRAEFNKGIKSAIEKGKLLSSTPKPFRKTKEFMYYDLMSPEQQKAIREKYGVVDDEAQNQSGENVHRMAESSSENPWDKKTTFRERSGVIPGNSSSEGLLHGSSGHLSRYSLATQEDVAKLQHGMADSKENVLKHVETAGGYMPDLGTGNNSRYRLPDEEQRAYMWNERRDPESEAAGRVTRNGSVEQVPVLEDPFYRSFRVNSPTYSYVYEHLRKLPLEKWGSHDHELWNTLVGMAEGGAVKFVLKDIVTDRKFLADYPELAMVPVSVEKDLPMPVMYDKARNRILLDRRVYLYPQSKFYIDGALRSVARDFEERRSSAERQVNEFNSGFRKRYDDAVTFAGKIAKMRELIPGFDESNGIAEAYMNEFGFMPDEFMRRFPTMDDYLLYRVTRGMNGLMDESLTPEQRMEKEKMLEKKITRHRKFFWGPIEIIMDAAGNGSNEGPLRVATAKDRENSGLPRSGLDRSESEALFMKYFPGVFRYFNIPDPTIRRDPTGWEEYKRIRNARKKAEKEKLMREEERRRAEEEERERERRRLEMN